MRKSLDRRHGCRRLGEQLSAAREAGMTTAEYAVGTIAACAFAALLLAIVQSGGIESLVTKVIKAALSVSL
ncbi:DUF4244 domain-containing protein [Ornithinimicrobium sp. F0845]|uniref:DUF4244 domain-containing protein n=1 Tax=Ornithinimicrobium sp. F0845 TaxID=2926412 RepID=UPI001FF31616|nr:DUF4244 domain-containing protein [Ornithinimicrobium sp. F0845]MCK0113133.1 DUF4244 domain-containing protein [Ornithinimicrobium sp. F0845]